MTILNQTSREVGYGRMTRVDVWSTSYQEAEKALRAAGCVKSMSAVVHETNEYGAPATINMLDSRARSRVYHVFVGTGYAESSK